LEGVWGKPSTSDVDDAAEGRTTSRRSDAPPAATENPPRSNDILGGLKAWAEKDFVSFSN